MSRTAHKLHVIESVNVNNRSIYLQVSMSAPAIFPFVPKWIRTNFPCKAVTVLLSDVLNYKITRTTQSGVG